MPFLQRSQFVKKMLRDIFSDLPNGTGVFEAFVEEAKTIKLNLILLL